MLLQRIFSFFCSFKHELDVWKLRFYWSFAPVGVISKGHHVWFWFHCWILIIIISFSLFICTSISSSSYFENSSSGLFNLWFSLIILLLPASSHLGLEIFNIFLIFFDVKGMKGSEVIEIAKLFEWQYIVLFLFDALYLRS